MRALASALAAALLVAASGCSGDDGSASHYGAQTATIGESLAVLGWNMSVTDMRFDGEYVLFDVDASPSDPDAPRVDPNDIRFGLYGTLSHPIEAKAIGSCGDLTDLELQPLSVQGERLAGTVCIGPQRDQAPVRGVYVYSPKDRIPATTTAYPAAFPVGLPQTKDNDTGLTLQTTSVDAFRGNGAMLDPAALGDPGAFTGQGYMLLGLQIDGLATQYRDVAEQRGGPAMVIVTPTLPAPGLSHACDVYGSSVLVLPDSSRDSVQLRVSLCTQGEINAALLYPTVTVAGTHAGLWTQDE
ncbi:hypothetical protein [Mycobacterium sp. IDR2000157661]|uniref:hypothetical protein n=1 Tax=Mycobacterium sp. IDR2000157661 TaxID=2867005 RepID=UPI001EEC74BE|nr:hypothetical protein [Mycobacterium sp. IDR2000157661]ULE34324.1 hypothetical protein K3G64_06720 [Mycobacterium sp. IDR2000157661]